LRPLRWTRVDDVAARAKENISRARRSAVILAFTAGAAALLGAAAAWFAACAGGRVRALCQRDPEHGRFRSGDINQRRICPIARLSSGAGRVGEAPGLAVELPAAKSCCG
jgi:hypothetical protein